VRQTIDEETAAIIEFVPWEEVSKCVGGGK
jgi:hypothetical protein